jgi:cytochrome c peroxidase
LEVQPLAPLTAPNEMAEDINTVIKKLQADPAYPPMFKAAFGSDQVSSQNMLKALTQFVAMMVSANSKYDKVKRGEAQFTVSEQAGYESFKQKCAACHQEPLFTDLSYRNDGFSINTSLQDVGRMRISGKSEDSLKFKVPSLRNVALTEPYTHDGRILSIGQMIDHYTSGIVNSPTLDPLLKNGIQISYAEKFYLIDFLKTLSDSSFIQDTRFSQPQQ